MARGLYAWMGVFALSGAAHCGSEAGPSTTGQSMNDVSVDDARPDGDEDAGIEDAAGGADADEARSDRHASADVSADSRDVLDAAADDRRAPDRSDDTREVDGGPPDAPASPDAASRDGADDGAIVDGGSTDAEPPADAPMRCNGHEALCDRRFDEVVFPTTHNAMSNAADGWLAPNQQYGMTRQLEDGIRAMLIDTHSYMGSTYLCHSSCLLGNKPLVEGLREVVTFLQSHPHEVLTLVIEDHITAGETETAFDASGLSDLAYVHPPGDPWPTLRAMIASGRRVLVGAESGSPPPGFYHHFYNLAWDTPYSFKSTSDFSCQQNRGNRQNALFLLNHWLENPLPDENLSRTANARDVLLSRARQCRTESGKLPNFVAVSHYAVGGLFDVVRELNGL